MRQIIPASWERELWEQPVIDLWSIPHFLSGGLFFYAFSALRLNAWAGFGLNILIAVLWELFEGSTGISASEFYSNHFSDILLSQAGYAAMWLVFMRYEEAQDRRRIAYAAAVLFAVMAVVGIAFAHFAH